VFGIITVFYLTDWPRQLAGSEDERDWLTLSWSGKASKTKGPLLYYWQALSQRDVILLTLCYFCATTGGLRDCVLAPYHLKRLSGQSDIELPCSASVPYLAGFLVQQLSRLALR